MTVLLLPLLQEWGFVDKNMTYQDLIHAKAKNSDDGQEVRLVRAYFTLAGHKGSDIRLESGPLATSSKPPLQAIDATQWQSQTVLQTKWQIDEHINSLEARAYVLMLRWHSRESAKHGTAFLHPKDSQVSIGAFLKHRSPSYTFNFLTQRAAALELACNFQQFLGFVRTHRNPADKPSRQQEHNFFNPHAGNKAAGGGRTA